MLFLFQGTLRGLCSVSCCVRMQLNREGDGCRSPAPHTGPLLGFPPIGPSPCPSFTWLVIPSLLFHTRQMSAQMTVLREAFPHRSRLFSGEELPRSAWPVGAWEALSWWLIEVGVPSPPWAAPFPGQVVPDYTKKQTSEPAGRVYPWFVLHVPAWVLVLTSLNSVSVNRKLKQTLFLPYVPFDQSGFCYCFLKITAIEIKVKFSKGNMRMTVFWALS